MTDYEKKVYSFLDNGKYNEWYTIDNLCAKNNQDKFIEIVKQYMLTHDWQCGWQFNTDYTKLKRLEFKHYDRNNHQQKNNKTLPNLQGAQARYNN